MTRPHPSTFLSIAALVVAMSSGAYAATALPKASVGTKQLKSDAVTTAKVKNGTITAADIQPGSLPPGPAGPQGPTGPVGPKGEAGTNASLNGVPAGGDLTGTYPNPTIGTDAVTSAKVAAGSLRLTDLAVWRQGYQVAPTTIGAQSCSNTNYGTPAGMEVSDYPVVRAETYPGPDGITLRAGIVVGATPTLHVYICNETNASITIPFAYTPVVYGIR